MEKLIKHANGQWELEKNVKADPLGINPNSKMKFKPDFDQKQFVKFVAEKADHMCATGYVRGEPEDWVWHYEPEFDIEKLIPFKKDRATWKAWFEGEMHEWRYDHGEHERANHFENWAKNPHKKPVIIIEGTDDRIHQIDGHHRTAMAIIKDMKTVPVIYGRRKTKNK